ncbi:hypothetical protein [Streptomyces sp. NPDC048442]|uniref:hypothetical protein n=1 Tax=Streptomyces sp. NPDC048442 TaxID=3154823 RepID=UPI0034194D5B
MASRLVGAEPDEPQDPVVADLVARRRTALDKGLQSVTRRIEALEAYADQTSVADAHYREFEQIQQLAEDHDRLLNFLARTASDQLAVAELEGLTEEAATITSTLAQTLTRPGSRPPQPCPRFPPH